MQHLRNTIVREHGQCLDVIKLSVRGAVERSPQVCNEDLRAFVEVYGLGVEGVSVGKCRDVLDEEIYEAIGGMVGRGDQGEGFCGGGGEDEAGGAEDGDALGEERDGVGVGGAEDGGEEGLWASLGRGVEGGGGDGVAWDLPVSFGVQATCDLKLRECSCI